MAKAPEEILVAHSAVAGLFARAEQHRAGTAAAYDRAGLKFDEVRMGFADGGAAKLALRPARGRAHEAAQAGGERRVR
jgi:hypothetical protein